MRHPFCRNDKKHFTKLRFYGIMMTVKVEVEVEVRASKGNRENTYRRIFI